MVKLNLVGDVDNMKEQIASFVKSLKKKNCHVVLDMICREQPQDLKRIHGEDLSDKGERDYPKCLYPKILLNYDIVIAVSIELQQFFIHCYDERKM